MTPKIKCPKCGADAWLLTSDVSGETEAVCPNDGSVITYRADEWGEAVTLFGPGQYCVTETPDDPSLNAVWVGFAHNPVDALDRYMVTMGHAEYSGTDESRSQVGVWADDDLGADPAGAFAPFTNTIIYSLPVDHGLKEEVPADRTILVHLNLTVSSGADSWPVEDIVDAIDGALQVGLEGAPIPKADAILNIAVSGEEV